jgi:hypothetical protein
MFLLLAVSPLVARLSASPAGEEAARKAPPPTAEAEEKAAKACRELFGPSYAKAKTAAEKIELAKEILKEAAGMEDDPAGCFVLLRLARDIAVRAGDLETAVTAIDALDGRFEVDALAMKADAAAKTVPVARPAAQHKAMAARISSLAREAMDKDKMERAAELAGLALEEAKKCRDPKLLKQIHQQQAEVAAGAEAKQQFTKALAALEQNPSDPAANLTVGKYRCGVQGDWDRGLNHLASAADETLRNLAKKELAGASSTDEQVDLADGWWAAADREDGTARTRFQKHAAAWYRKASADAKGLAKVKIETRLAKLAEAEAEASASPEEGVQTAGSAREGHPRKAKPFNVEGLKAGPKFTAHPILQCVGFNPKGTLLATGGFGENLIKLWDVKTGELRGKLDGQAGCVFATVYSPDGSMLATALEYGVIKIWDSAGRVTATLRGHTGAVLAVSFPPRAAMLASGGSDSSVALWDLRNANRQVLAGHGARVASVAFSPDGSELASASDDRTVKIWDVRKAAAKKTLPHPAPVTCVAFSPDGSILASASQDRLVRLWNPAMGQLRGMLPEQNGAVYAVAFSTDGAVIATGSDDGQLALWKVRGGQLLKTLDHARKPVRAVAFSPDGSMLASGTRDGTVQIWTTK